RHHNGDGCCNSGRDPKEPAPVQRRHTPNPKKYEAGKQRWTQIKNPEAPKVDHETEDAAESSAFARAEPGGVDFYHARCTKRLKVPVDPADGDEEPKQSPERGQTKKEVHQHSSGGTDEHRAFAPETVGEQAVENLATGIRQEPCGNDRAHVRFAEVILVTDRPVRDREIVTTHIERCVEQADKAPVHSAPAAIRGRMMDRNLSHKTTKPQRN